MHIISTYYKRNEGLKNLFVFSYGLASSCNGLLMYCTEGRSNYKFVTQSCGFVIRILQYYAWVKPADWNIYISPGL